jgi:hypothetical protein
MPILTVSALAAAIGIFAATAVPSSEPPAIDRKIVRPDVTVTPAPITSDSKPFLASRDDLAAHGYVEEEFFISGRARAYEWIGDTLKIRAVTQPGPYTTRILVRRPIDPKRFSGDIEVETLNATNGIDVTTTMETSPAYVMRRGDVWIGVTSKPLTVKALKRFDPARYADLTWSNPAPPAQRCAHPSIIPVYSFGDPKIAANPPPISTPDSEDGLIWDIYAQLGALLKSSKRNLVLPGFSSPHLFATGYSQSGLIQRTFISGFHNVMRVRGGGPIFDGYLIEVGPAMLRINQCSHDILPDDPRNRLPIVDVPVINIVSEGDMWLGLHTRQPDVVHERSGLVTYEIAGAPHKAGMGDAGHPTADEAARAGLKAPLISPPTGVVLNDLPRGYLSTAALRNLQLWAHEGRSPPRGEPMATEGSAILRDDNGNAIGGVRNPWIDVPTATYHGNLGRGPMAVFGGKVPFEADKLRSLYPTHADYVAKFKASVESAVAERWLLPEDAAAIVQRVGSSAAP